MVISEFTRPEIDYFLEKCNFTDFEEKFFLLRSQGKSLLETAEILNISRRTADTYSKKIRKKIIKVL